MSFEYDKNKLIANGENYSNLKELLQELVDNLHIEVSGGQVKLGVIVGGALTLDSNKVLRATNSDQKLIKYCYYGTNENGDYGIQVYNNVETKGVFGGGYGGSSYLNTIDYITISSLGNAHDFGDLTDSKYGLAATSNGTDDRGVFGGGSGSSSSYLNVIDYVTISSLGNAHDFGDLTDSKYGLAATSNGIDNRGVFGGGHTRNNYGLWAIDYVTISSSGNATNFGSLTDRRCGLAATSNGIDNRGVFGGGDDSYKLYNTIDYITISSLGNAHDFGDLTAVKRYLAATSNGASDRGVFGGGYNGSNYQNTIDYVTISSPGNATDFGDLTVGRDYLAATSNGIDNRGVFGGGRSSSNNLNVIDYVTISSLGNAQDFGDLTIGRYGLAATSNA